MKNKKEPQQNTLTSAQRKELRRQELEKQTSNGAAAKTQEPQDLPIAPKPEEQSDVIGAVETGFGQSTLSRNKLWIIITAAVAALIMILFAILIPFVIAPRLRYSHIPHHAVVEFTLNTRDPNTNARDRIAIVVYHGEVPHTSINFIHLARMGFFNDTIIFDTSHNFVRFGQYEDATFRSFRTRNEDFINRNARHMARPLAYHNWNPEEHATQIRPFDGDSPFDFRITQDSNVSHLRDTNEGVVSLMTQFSSTDFQISLGSFGGIQPLVQLPTHRQPSTDTPLNLTGRPFGHVTSDTMPVVQRIAQMAQVDSAAAPHPFFRPPQESVRIVSTRVYNIDFWGKWRTFSWNDYFAENRDDFSWVGGSSFRAPNDTQQLR